jgi:hypothetical protein
MLTPAMRISNASPTNQLNLAGQIPLRLHIGRESTPVPLIRRRAILPNAVWLVWLIKGLKVEQVDTPVEHATDAALPVGDGVVRAGNGGAVAGAAISGPAGLAVPEFRGGGRAGDGLDVVEGLHDVVEVGGGCVGDFLGLPVGEGVDEAEQTVNQAVGG